MRFNPFDVVTHNTVKLPRILHHGAHMLPGVLGVALHLAAPHYVPLAVTVGIAILGEAFLKCSWFDWHRSSGRLWHFSLRHDRGIDVPDWISDFCLAQLPVLAFLTPTPIPCVIATYYLLSLFNGT